MRVTRRPVLLPYTVSIDELSDIVSPEGLGYDSISEAFSNRVFELISPGIERTCIVFRAEGFDCSEIAWILGKQKSEIEKIIANIRKRFEKFAEMNKLTQ